MAGKANNIKVMVRVRPFNSRELKEDGKVCVQFDDNNKGKLGLGPKSFNYDWVGGLETKQQDIFDYIGVPLVNTCLEGNNLLLKDKFSCFSLRLEFIR